MQVISSVKRLQAQLQKLKTKKTIAFVPTMGGLHDGHLSLVRLAKKKADVVVVSIFVNPTQFDQAKDFQTYPITIQNDLKLLKKENVDFVFTPKAKEMYPEGFQTKVILSELTQGLCGFTRPGHFDGVATVVLKLFNIVQPHMAVFGKKDYQQLLLIKRMVKDLNLPVQILGAPLKREKDGLAMSSRNLRLSKPQRQQALGLSRSLKKAKEASQKPSATLVKIQRAVLKELQSFPKVKIDYLEFRHKDTLQKLKAYQKGKTLVALATFVGPVRLIDNIIV